MCRKFSHNQVVCTKWEVGKCLSFKKQVSFLHFLYLCYPTWHSKTNWELSIENWVKYSDKIWWSTFNTKIWYRCKNKNVYHIKSHHWKSIVSCRGTNWRLFAQYLFSRVVVFLLECYFLIKYLYSLRSNLKNVIHKKRTHICEVYFKNVVFLIIPLNYWN